MKKELQNKLFEAFPLIYGDRTLPMSQTAMCWGVDTREGWFDLIYELSGKLEAIVAKIKDETEHCSCENCCHQEAEHGADGSCQTIVRRPFVFKAGYSYEVPILRASIKRNKGNLFKGALDYLSVLKKKYVFKMKLRANRISHLLAKHFYLYQNKKCFCNHYQQPYPRISQIKEKMGSLRVYLTTGTEEMYKLIDAASARSSKVCEVCGCPGDQNDYGWIETLCERCRSE